MKAKSFYQVTWHAEIVLLIGSKNEVEQYISRKYYDNEKLEENNSGLTWAYKDLPQRGTIYVVWLLNPQWDTSTIKTVVHESLHCADKILLDRKVCFAENHGEAHAYLQEWIFEKIYMFLGDYLHVPKKKAKKMK